MTDITNEFLVSWSAGEILIMNPPLGRISKKRALVLAAWLIAIANDDGTFSEILERVENS